MIDKLFIIEGDSNNPHRNLALEAVLLKRLQPGECYLYLWQNKHTVVIGRNQNALSECHVQQLEQDGGFLARRLSGGGAVYHDLGNLNFTMIMNSGDFDTDRQTGVILTAVQLQGLNAEKNGRNDLTIEGKKFSGHAYYHHDGRSYHHGTLMMNVDMSQLPKYLNVSPLKLRAKGVQSVQSRVCNLADLNPHITVDAMKESLREAFCAVYGLPVRELELTEADMAFWQSEEARMSAPEWLYGEAKVLDFSKEMRFGWGTVRMDYSLSKDKQSVQEMQLWTDGLEAEFLQEVPGLLQGCCLKRDAILARLSMSNEASPRIADDIAAMLLPA
ncbi:lipoate--protein ligase [Anaerovibrio sp.]|uniref:lipoate--protein ligase n=1 Tax=Anaerovibrio sp. TaxID=1872532 RepID=UPI003F158987